MEEAEIAKLVRDELLCSGLAWQTNEETKNGAPGSPIAGRAVQVFEPRMRAPDSYPSARSRPRRGPVAGGPAGAGVPYSQTSSAEYGMLPQPGYGPPWTERSPSISKYLPTRVSSTMAQELPQTESGSPFTKRWWSSRS